MFNMLRADTYRLLHSRGFYITQFVMIGLVVVSVATDSLSMMIGSAGLSSFQNQASHVTWTAVNSVKLMSSMASLLLYILLPLFIMSIGFDFSRKIYKNPLSSGMTRLNYFISKYFVFVLITVGQLLFYYGVIFLSTGIKSGFGKLTVLLVKKWVQVFSLQLLELNAIFAISVLVIYLSFSTIAAVITTVVTPVLIPVLLQLFTKAHWLRNFDFQSRVDSAYFTQYRGTDLSGLMIASFGMILGCLLVAYISFRKREL